MIEQFLLIGLAGWRLASLLVNEQGPFFIFTKLRDFVQGGLGPIPKWRIYLMPLFDCIWCMSVWTTLGAYLLWQIEPVSVMIVAAMSITLIMDSFNAK